MFLLYLNDVIAFIIELISLVLWGKLALFFFKLPVLKIIMTIIILVLIITLWGKFFSPKASIFLASPIYYSLKALILILPAFQFVKTHPKYLIFYVLIVICHLMIHAIWGRADWS